VSMPAKCSVWLMPGMDHTPRDGGAISACTLRRCFSTTAALVGQLRSGMVDLAAACLRKESITEVGRQAGFPS
jgi:hypothetical protein